MRSIMSSKFLTLVFAVFIFSLAMANPDATQKKAIAVRVNPHPPMIDGKLSDNIWQKAKWHGDFTQREPEDGAAPTEKTQFKILYDDEHLYIGIRAFDSQPETITSRVTRRDGFNGDWVEVNIDSYFDHRTAFSFTVNAAGVKGDEFISNDGDNWDTNWNPIWHVGVNHDAEGWTAEMKIPFSQLRFANKGKQIWGLELTRRLFRKDERSVWQYIPNSAPGWVSNFGELHGIQNIKQSRRIEILPYGVSDFRSQPKESDNPFSKGRETNLSGGLDAKIGVTSDLTMDVTINPDFGQVEADPSEVNLSAFETFFPEKRTFFIEGNNIFEYRVMTGDGGFSNDRLFYSRRIGRQPQYEPELDDSESTLSPNNTSILTAMKLSGKTRSGLSIGVLNAITEKEIAPIDLNGARRQETVEPLTNYFIGRVQKDFNKGNTSVGGIFTSVNRDLDHDALKANLSKAAYTGGFDLSHRWHEKKYHMNLKTTFSNVTGDSRAIADIQQSSQRYYQRPDADYVTFDSTRTSLSGHGGYFNIGMSGKLRGSLGAMWRSPGFELNDMGFLRQADRLMQWTWLGYNIDKPVGIFRKLRMNFNQWQGWNFGQESVFSGGNINGGGQLKNYWNFWNGIGREGSLSTSELRGGPALKFPARWNYWFNVSTDDRKTYRLGMNGSNSWQNGGHSRRHNLSFRLELRPKNSIQIQLNPFVNFNKNDLQYIDTVDFNGGDEYLLGRLDQKTVGITMRVDYAITPNLTIQYYGQPFVSAGKYLDFKRITNPRSASYSDRFETFTDAQLEFNNADEVINFDQDLDGNSDYELDFPDFSFREFRSNLVVRWEYQPGSTVFFVWTQDRSGDDSDGNFSFKRGVEQLFEEESTNIFLVKVSKWFSL